MLRQGAVAIRFGQYIVVDPLEDNVFHERFVPVDVAEERAMLEKWISQNRARLEGPGAGLKLIGWADHKSHRLESEIKVALTALVDLAEAERKASVTWYC